VKVSAQIGLVFFEETTSVVIQLTPGAQPATQVAHPFSAPFRNKLSHTVSSLVPGNRVALHIRS